MRSSPFLGANSIQRVATHVNVDHIKKFMCGRSASSLGSSLLGYSSYGLRDNGGMVMGVVTGVEEMVVECPVEPVVQELNRSYVKQCGDDGSLGSPPWHATHIRDGCVGHVEEQPIEDDLVIPVQNSKDHLALQDI